MPAIPMPRPSGLPALPRRFEGEKAVMLTPRVSGGGTLPHVLSRSLRLADASISGRLRCVARRFEAAEDVADVGVPTRDVPADAATVPGRRRSMPITVVLWPWYWRYSGGACVTITFGDACCGAPSCAAWEKYL